VLSIVFHSVLSMGFVGAEYSIYYGTYIVFTMVLRKELVGAEYSI